MTVDPEWLNEKRIDIQLRMLHLLALANDLDPEKNEDLWFMRLLLLGALYSLWRAMSVLPADDEDIDTADDEPPAKRNPFDEFIKSLAEGKNSDCIEAANPTWTAAHDTTNAAARLLVLGQAKGADAVLSANTRAKCAQLNPELLMMLESGTADISLMWSMALHVFDHALADVQAAAGTEKRPQT